MAKKYTAKFLNNQSSGGWLVLFKNGKLMYANEPCNSSKVERVWQISARDVFYAKIRELDLSTFSDVQEW